MNILLAVDGSIYTKKMLAYLAAHDEMLGSSHTYTAITVQPQLPPRARAALGKEVVDKYHAEEGEKVLSPVVKFMARHGVQLKTMTKVGPAGETIAKVAESGKPARFAVVTNKSIKQAVLEPRGEERLELAGEQLDTVRLHAFAEKDDLDIDIWLSRRHSLLPVRIRITDDKGGVLDQRASRIEAGAAATAARKPN